MTETDGDLDFNVAFAELLQPQESPQLNTENQPESPPQEKERWRNLFIDFVKDECKYFFLHI